MEYWESMQLNLVTSTLRVSHVYPNESGFRNFGVSWDEPGLNLEYRPKLAHLSQSRPGQIGAFYELYGISSNYLAKLLVDYNNALLGLSWHLGFLSLNPSPDQIIDSVLP